MSQEIQINKIHSDSPKKMARALNNFDINSFKSPFYLERPRPGHRLFSRSQASENRGGAAQSWSNAAGQEQLHHLQSEEAITLDDREFGKF